MATLADLRSELSDVNLRIAEANSSLKDIDNIDDYIMCQFDIRRLEIDKMELEYRIEQKNEILRLI